MFGHFQEWAMNKPIIGSCLAMLFCAAAVAQSTETVLYSFASPPDGGGPFRRASI